MGKDFRCDDYEIYKAFKNNLDSICPRHLYKMKKVLTDYLERVHKDYPGYKHERKCCMECDKKK